MLLQCRATAPLLLMLATALACQPLRAAQPASQDLREIAAAAERHAVSHARRLRLKNIDARAQALDARLQLAPCGHALETFSAPGRGAGRTTVGVRCTLPKPWTLYVPVQVKASLQTVVLREAMPRGSVLSSADLAVSLRPAETLYGEHLSSVAAATGKQLRRDLKAGAPLRLSMLTDPQAIARGQSTQLLSVVNNIEVVMNGTALSGGSAGDTIKVRNNTSGRQLEGVVTLDGRVRVN
jgi:flagella basal body P-ring formation protein FlgA